MVVNLEVVCLVARYEHLHTTRGRVFRFDEVQIAVDDGEDAIASFVGTEAASGLKVECGIARFGRQTVNFDGARSSVFGFDEVHVSFVDNESPVLHIIWPKRRDGTSLDRGIVIVRLGKVDFDRSGFTVPGLNEEERSEGILWKLY